MDQGKRRLALQRGGLPDKSGPPGDPSFMRQVREARQRQAIAALPGRLGELTVVVEQLTAAVNELRSVIALVQKEQA